MGLLRDWLLSEMSDAISAIGENIEMVEEAGFNVRDFVNEVLGEFNFDDEKEKIKFAKAIMTISKILTLPEDEAGEPLVRKPALKIVKDRPHKTLPKDPPEG